MTTAPPLYWLRQVQDKQRSLMAIPLWGHAPTFPWEAFSQQLGELLEVPDFSLTPNKKESLPENSFLSSLGPNPKALSFQLSPLQGTLTLLFPAEPMAALLSLLFYGKSTAQPLDPRFQEGFYQFLLLQTSHLFESMGTYPDLHIQWLEENSSVDPTSFCISIDITAYGKTFYGVLCLPSSFQASCRAHYEQKTASFLDSPAAHALTIPLRLCLGYTQLHLTEWDTLQVGDLLVLDRCTYDPEEAKGTADLLWEEIPLFTVKIKPTSLKIADYAVYHGESKIMNTEYPTSFSDDDIPFPDIEGEELPEDEAAEALPQDKEQSPKAAPISPHGAPVLPMKDVPLPIVVELDELKMSLEKLLELQPGNVLELATHPEQGVYLSVHGKRVARGELMKIGDVLGVKILEIGTKHS
ncbi:MAG: YscQ/HrcQ family type III secretion apparatus protein [Chlamydiae bacterium]|nr:YscQ/HrcQ family type III secretion apparatus protein [Chlamydiota bacterium]